MFEIKNFHGKTIYSQYGNFGLEVEICTVFTYFFRFLFLLDEKLSVLILNMMKLFGAQGSRKGILLERPLP